MQSKPSVARLDDDKPIVDIVTLQRDLYIVMSLLLADKAVVKLKDWHWTGYFFENEVKRLLLWVAVATRSLLDLDFLKKSNIQNKCCGEYWEDFSGKRDEPTSISLRFRQACNSMIHAEEILPYKAPMKERKNNTKRAYSDRITVRGSHKKKATRAYVDMILFAQAINALIEELETASEQPEAS